MNIQDIVFSDLGVAKTIEEVQVYDPLVLGVHTRRGKCLLRGVECVV
jgi:hypothetical protein